MLKGLRKRLAIIFTVFTGAVLAAVLGVSLYYTVLQQQQTNDMWFSSTVQQVTGTLMNNAVGGEPTSLYSDDYLITVKENGQAMAGLVSTVGPEGTAAVRLGEADENALFTQARAIAEENALTEWIDTETVPYSAVLSGRVVEDDYAIAAQPAMPTLPAEGEIVQFDSAYNDIGVVTIAMGPLLGTEGIFTLKHEGVRYRATYYSMDMAVPAGGTSTYEVGIFENLAEQDRGVLLTCLGYALLLLAGLALLYLANWFLARLVLRPTEEGLRRQTEFVAAASHELRSPLAVIRSSLSAARDTPDPKQAEKFQTAADDEAHRMTRLVDDLLLLAGGDAGSWQLQKAPVDLDTLLIDAAEVYRPMARQREVGLALHLPEAALPQVQGDAERLRQVLAVLMDNALQYAPPGTDVTLAAEYKKGKIKITVADRGRGIPDEEKEQVFRRFYRADKSRHDKNHFGLGLSIARELAELHGGRLTAGDTRDGGATLTLTLPVAR